MYLYGGSGHARVIRDIIEACGYTLEGVIDINPNLLDFMGFPVFPDVTDDVRQMIISIGSNKIRQRIGEQYKGKIEFPAVVHPSAIVSPHIEIGEGTVVMQGAILQSSTRIGRHCIINTGASIDHECQIGDYAHISPHATLCGNVHVGEGTWVGAGSVAIPGIRIGRWSVVGAGSVIVRDIPDGVVAYGNPCRVVKEIL